MLLNVLARILLLLQVHTKYHYLICIINTAAHVWRKLNLKNLPVYNNV